MIIQSNLSKSYARKVIIIIIGVDGVPINVTCKRFTRTEKISMSNAFEKLRSWWNVSFKSKHKRLLSMELMAF